MGPAHFAHPCLDARDRLVTGRRRAPALGLEPVGRGGGAHGGTVVAERAGWTVLAEGNEFGVLPAAT
jgi:hypothetical protein